MGESMIGVAEHAAILALTLAGSHQFAAGLARCRLICRHAKEEPMHGTPEFESPHATSVGAT